MVLRTMMCVATALSVIAIIVLPFGMECSKFFDSHLNKKRKIIKFCGVCVTAAGMLTLLYYVSSIFKLLHFTTVHTFSNQARLGGGGLFKSSRSFGACDVHLL